MKTLRQDTGATGALIVPGQSQDDNGKPESSSIASNHLDMNILKKDLYEKNFNQNLNTHVDQISWLLKKSNLGGPFKINIIKSKTTENTNKICLDVTGLFVNTTTKLTIPKLRKRNPTADNK